MLLKEVSSFIQKRKKSSIPELKEIFKASTVEVESIINILKDMGKIRKNSKVLSCNSKKGCGGCSGSCAPSFEADEYYWAR